MRSVPLISFLLLVSTTCDYTLEPMKLAITADNIASNLYVDGVRTPMPNYSDWQKVDIIIIPGDTRVIAVQAHDDGVIAGLLASIGEDYFLTNQSWKCTTQLHANWMQPSFDDSSWPAAVYVQPNSAANQWHHHCAEVSSQAVWIWTKNFHGVTDPVVYCRGRLPAADVGTFDKNKLIIILASVSGVVLVAFIVTCVVVAVLWRRRSNKRSTLRKQQRQQQQRQEMMPISAAVSSGYPVTSGVYDEINTEEVYDEIDEENIGYTIPNVENSEPLPNVRYQPLRGAAEVSKDENANQSTSEPEHVDMSVIGDDKNADHEYLQVLDDEATDHDYLVVLDDDENPAQANDP